MYENIVQNDMNKFQIHIQSFHCCYDSQVLLLEEKSYNSIKEDILIIVKCTSNLKKEVQIEINNKRSN